MRTIFTLSHSLFFYTHLEKLQLTLSLDTPDGNPIIPFCDFHLLKWRSTLGLAQTGPYVNTVLHVFACILCRINHGPDISFLSRQGFYRI